MMLALAIAATVAAAAYCWHRMARDEATALHDAQLDQAMIDHAGHVALPVFGECPLPSSTASSFHGGPDSAPEQYNHA